METVGAIARVARTGAELGMLPLLVEHLAPHTDGDTREKPLHGTLDA